MKTALINLLYRIEAEAGAYAHEHTELAWSHLTYDDWYGEELDCYSQSFEFTLIGRLLIWVQDWANHALWKMGEPPF